MFLLIWYNFINILLSGGTFRLDYNDLHNDSITKEKDGTFFHSVEEASEFFLHQHHGCFETEDVIEDGRLVLPEWNIAILPVVSEIGENLVHTYYYITSPDWDMTLFECSSAIGSDIRQAMGMAQGGFIFGIINAIGNMVRDENAREFETEFAGNIHRWKVYLGNIVGMGKMPQETAQDIYWEALKEGIAKRIGNQKLCYVKIYGANIGNGSYTGECRINDVKIDELSEIVEEIVKTWGTSEFGSHKQFFMIKQDEDTTLYYPFTSDEIADKTEIAMKMFEDCETGEEYEVFEQTLEQVVGDKDLAWELYSFIPEICAQNAFDKIKYPETILINVRGESIECFKTQLASYYAILNGVFRTFNRGVLKDADKVYRKYISISSVWSVICSAKEGGHNLEEEEGGQICIMFNPEDDYTIR